MVLIFKFMLCSTFFLGDVIDAYRSCPSVALPNAKVTYVNRGKKVKFSCFKPYTLIGRSRLDCVYNSENNSDEWDGALPLCAMKNCDKFPKLLHGKISYFNEASIAKANCDADFTLIGSPFMFCDQLGWNDTAPECLANSITQFETCHFEPDETDLCKWISKPVLFNWTIISSDRHENPYLPDKEYPAHDHSLSPHTGGHFLYLESLFSPSKTSSQILQRQNGAAKYISPLFPATGDENERHCVIFYLYTNGPHAAAVEVLIDDESAWKNNGSLGDEWHKVKIPLPFLSRPFRVTIEGIGQLGYFSNTAIDDLKVVSGEECKNYQIVEEIHTEINEESTTGFHETVTIKQTENEHTISHQNDTEIQHSAMPTSRIADQSNFTILPNIPKNTSLGPTTPELKIELSNQTPSAVFTKGTGITLKSTLTPSPTSEVVAVRVTSAIKSEITTQPVPTTVGSFVNLTNDVQKSPIEFHSIENTTTQFIKLRFLPKEKIEQSTLSTIVNAESNSVHFNNNSLKNETVSFTTQSTSRPHPEYPLDEDENSFIYFYNNIPSVQSNDHETSTIDTTIDNEISTQDRRNESTKSVSNTTHLTSVSLNDSIGEPNKSKYEYDHHETNKETDVQQKGGDGHSERVEKDLETKNKFKSDPLVKKPSKGKNSQKDDSLSWILLSTVICGVSLFVLILIFMIISKKYYHKYRNKDEGSIQFFIKENTPGITSRKDEVMILNCVSKDT